METRFTWDSAKAEKNQRIHGIAFETAKEVFDDPNHMAGENYFIERESEQRYQVIGMTKRWSCSSSFSWTAATRMSN